MAERKVHVTTTTLLGMKDLAVSKNPELIGDRQQRRHEDVEDLAAGELDAWVDNLVGLTCKFLYVQHTFLHLITSKTFGLHVRHANLANISANLQSNES